jgi:hypothetical protein
MPSVHVLGAAEEDLALGDIGYPTLQRDQLRHATSRRP